MTTRPSPSASPPTGTFRPGRAAPSGGVLITGAARRIGGAIAHELAAHGWAVAVHHKSSPADAQGIVAAIKAAGGHAVAIEGDLTRPAELHGLIPRGAAALGRPLTCLVNNASLFEEDALETLDPERWGAHLSVNLTAPVFLTKAFAAALPAGEKGNVINIIDQRVLRPIPLFFSYSVSKAALWSATQMMAQALAPRIRVNAIGPGPVLRSIHQTEQQYARQVAATPLERATPLDEIARAIIFILDQPSMTGQMIALDGGQHLAWRTPDVVDVEGAPKPPANTAAIAARTASSKGPDVQ